MRYFSLMLVIWASITLASGQERLRFLNIEAGMNFVESKMEKNDRIRSDQSMQYDSYIFQSVESELSRFYFGVKAELRAKNNFLGLIAGLRFSSFQGSISKQISPDYFFYLFRTAGTTTEYLRVKSFTQRASYVSIPLEGRVFSYRERQFRLYFLLGFEFGTRIGFKNKVEFENPAMDQYESNVAGMISSPRSTFAAGYGRCGFIIGNEKPWIDIGITAPFVVSQVSSLNDPGLGGGFHIQAIKKF